LVRARLDQLLRDLPPNSAVDAVSKTEIDFRFGSGTIAR
jgi:hypothetical protein